MKFASSGQGRLEMATDDRFEMIESMSLDHAVKFLFDNADAWRFARYVHYNNGVTLFNCKEWCDVTEKVTKIVAFNVKTLTYKIYNA